MNQTNKTTHKVKLKVSPFRVEVKKARVVKFPRLLRHWKHNEPGQKCDVCDKTAAFSCSIQLGYKDELTKVLVCSNHLRFESGELKKILGDAGRTQIAREQARQLKLFSQNKGET